jgi:hypothetical protein
LIKRSFTVKNLWKIRLKVQFFFKFIIASEKDQRQDYAIIIVNLILIRENSINTMNNLDYLCLKEKVSPISWFFVKNEIIAIQTFC